MPPATPDRRGTVAAAASAIRTCALVARPDLFTNPGGDTTQIRETATELRALGVDARIVLADRSRSEDLRASVARVDVVHCFNILLAFQYEDLLNDASRRRIPVVLSPVYWDMEQFEGTARGTAAWKRIAALTASHLRAFTPVSGFLRSHVKSVTYNRVYREYLHDILQRVDLLLPNSESEYYALRNRFQTTTPWSVVINGCRVPDYASIHAPVSEPYLLCVGRIERRKNQRMLIRAMEGMPFSLVLLGNVNLAEASYWEECKAEARERGVRLLHRQGCEWIDVWPYYHHAAVHVQPSWFETPGLSSLEAAAVGCPVVCTSVGSAPEYFGSRAWYCVPDRVDSIRSAISEAVRAPRPDAHAAAFVRERFSWQHAARQTLAAYERVAGSSVAYALHA